VAELDQRIKTLTREQKMLNLEQYRREKRLDKIIQKGEPENFQEVQMQSKVLSQLTDKLWAVQRAFDKFVEGKEEQDKKLEAWKDRVEDLEQRAKAAGVDEKAVQEKEADQEAYLAKEQLVRQKRI